MPMYPVRRFHKAYRALCLALLSFAALPASAATLVDDGRPRAVIVIPPDALPHTASAAAELARYVERISGAALPVTDDPDSSDAPVRIWVGYRPEMEAFFPEQDLVLAHPEEVCILVRGEQVAVFGRDRAVNGIQTESGTHHAVMVFLHDHLDVRWLWPGELGEDLIPRPTIALDEQAYRYHPQVRQRHLRIVNHARSLSRMNQPPAVPGLAEDARAKDRETEDWFRRNHGLYPSLVMSAGHAFGRWWEDYHEAHPDYFALQADGTRSAFPRTERVKLCVSNPGVAARWLDNAERDLNANPARSMVSASPNDSAYSGKCICDDCRAWDHPEGAPITLNWRGHQAPWVALTDRYVRFWNRLANGLRERFPDRDVQVGAWAYGPYRTPPLGVELEPNIAIGFVGSFSSAPAASREADRELWRGWAGKASQLIWRPNLFWGSGPLNASSGPIGLPMLFLRRSAEDFRFLAGHRMVGLDVDSIFNHWATQGVQYYLLSRLAWNPEADADAILHEYYHRGFGPAAEAVAEYFAYFEQIQYDLLERAAGRNQLAMAEIFPEVYTPEVLDEAGRLLDRAAGNLVDAPDLYRQRLAFIHTGLDWVRAQMDVFRAVTALRTGRGGSADLGDRIRAALDACDVRDRILYAHRRTHALGFFQYLGSVEHRGMQRILGPVEQRYLDLLGAEDRLQPLPSEWDFRLDPGDRGREERWFEADGAPGNWGRILVTDWWGNQLASDDPDDPEGRNYLGVAWYRLDVEDLAPVPDGQQLWLELGAVDESCWVYVNGRVLGEQVYDSRIDPDAWKRVRRFDISSAIRAGTNRFTVRVQALAGQGGIWQGAWLRTTPRNLLDNGGFERGLDGWAFTGEEWAQDPAFLPGSHVGEQALHLEKSASGAVRLTAAGVLPEAAANRYLFSVRFRQQPRTVPGGLERWASIRLTLYPRDRDAEPVRSWIHTPATAIDEWRALSESLVPADGAVFSRYRVTVFLDAPGSVTFDEFRLQAFGP